MHQDPYAGPGPHLSPPRSGRIPAPDSPGEQDQDDEFGEFGIINFLIPVICRYFPGIPAIRAGKSALTDPNGGFGNTGIDLHYGGMPQNAFTEAGRSW
jgi:hypothetical protein